MSAPVLMVLTETHRDAFLEYMGDFGRAGELDYVDETVTPQTFPSLVERLNRESTGIDLKPGYVPATTWFLWDGQRILGRASIRHRLTPHLEDIGGHIGYDIRPSARGRGYGNLLLALALERARKMGLPRVLITCDPANTPSVRVILHNGGQLASESPAATAHNRPTQRYWVSTGGQQPSNAGEPVATNAVETVQLKDIGGRSKPAAT